MPPALRMSATCPTPVCSVASGGNPWSPSDVCAAPVAPVERLIHCTDALTEQPQPRPDSEESEPRPPATTTTPDCSPTIATQLAAKVSKLPAGLPNGAELIWNGTVVAAAATPAADNPGRANTTAHMTSLRTNFMTGLYRGFGLVRSRIELSQVLDRGDLSGRGHARGMGAVVEVANLLEHNRFQSLMGHLEQAGEHQGVPNVLWPQICFDCPLVSLRIVRMSHCISVAKPAIIGIGLSVAVLVTETPLAGYAFVIGAPSPYPSGSGSLDAV